MSIERDKDFEQLEDIAAMMAENPGIEFENGKYVYYGLDPRTAFAVVYIGGAWAGWQAKANAVPKWIPVEDELPSDGQNIIAFDAIKHCVFKDGEFLQGYFEPDTGHEYTEPVDVTHWIAIEAQEPK